MVLIIAAIPMMMLLFLIKRELPTLMNRSTPRREKIESLLFILFATVLVAAIILFAAGYFG